MDVKTTHDQAVSTETLHIKKTPSSNTIPKVEKKKSDSKKLKKKIVEIEEKNDSLNTMIQNKNSEIVELRKSVNSLNDVLNSVPIDELRCNSSIASTKLLELSKKNRQLRAELETTKNRLNKKDLQLQKLEKDLKMVEERSHQEADFIRKESFSPVEEMQTKMNALQQKLFETRNRNVELNTQLKLAHKCLQQEVGEHFNLNILASHATSSNWRGRAQQIIHLQQKIQELKERLDNTERKNSGRNQLHQFDIGTSEAMAYNTSLLASGGSLTNIDRPSVRKTELQHRAKVDALENEITSLTAQLEDQRGKILALKVRNKTLNDEISRYKMKTFSMEEQTDFNKINVASMNDKLSQQKSFYEKQIDELSHEFKKLVKQRDDMENNEEYMRDKMNELESLITSKDETIQDLCAVKKKLEDDLKTICGGFLFSCREFRKEEFLTILDSLEAEKNSLMDHNKTLNIRITEERNKSDNLQEQVSKQKIRIARLETKVRDLERELETQSEKKRRSQRIAEYTTNLSTIGSSTSLCSLTFENMSLMNAQKSSSGDALDCNVTELKNRLELATEKITILKEKLDHITAEKENDLTTFQQIINNTKNIILETIEGQRNNSSIDDN